MNISKWVKNRRICGAEKGPKRRERELVCEYLWDWCKWCTLPLIAVIVSSSANVSPPPSSILEPEKEYFPDLPSFG